MNTKHINKKFIIITFFILFLLMGVIFLSLYYSKNLSEYLSMGSGLTNLMYLPMFLTGGLSALAVAVFLSVLLLIQIKSIISTKLLISILVITLVGFSVFNVVNVFKYYTSYEEVTYFSAMDDMDNMLPPEESVAKFFPFYESMETSANQTPYYAFSEYKLDNTIYKIAQIECNDYENFCAFTTEYFETDKSYLSSKFISEKSFHYSLNEDGELLNTALIQHERYNDIEYDLIEQSTEKIIIISDDGYYFLFHYQDSMNLLNLSTQEFLDTAYEQFNYLKENS